MAIYFDKPQENLGGTVGAGINRLVQKKISDLQRRHQIDERKATYREANLPEWLAELPEEKQSLLLKEWQFLPEEEKETVREHLEKTGESLKQEQNAMMQQYAQQSQQQPQQQFRAPQEQSMQINPEQGASQDQMAQGNQAFRQAPMQEGVNRQLESNRTIPGLNTLMQAGEGMQRDSGGSSEAQSFPRLGHGTQGQPGPMESAQPAGPKKYRMVPKNRTGDEQNFLRKEQSEANKQSFREQQALQPFLNKEAADIQAQKRSADIAEDMLDNLKKNKKKWPGFFKGNLSAFAGEKVLRDPDIRKYIADAHKLVSAEANKRRGLPTNFKLKLEALSKADLSQPYETQVKLLEDIIASRDESRARQRFIDSQKDIQGNYPKDIQRKVIEFDDAMDNPLKYPQYFSEGDEYEDNEGVNHTIKNGKWIKE